MTSDPLSRQMCGHARCDVVTEHRFGRHMVATHMVALRISDLDARATRLGKAASAAYGFSARFTLLA